MYWVDIEFVSNWWFIFNFDCFEEGKLFDGFLVFDKFEFGIFIIRVDFDIGLKVFDGFFGFEDGYVGGGLVVVGFDYFWV